MMFASKLRSLAFMMTLAWVGVLAASRAEASELLESGSNYFVVQNDAGGTTGSVIMRMDLSFDSDGELAVSSRILPFQLNQAGPGLFAKLEESTKPWKSSFPRAARASPSRRSMLLGKPSLMAE